MNIDFGKWAFRNSRLIHFLIAVLIVGGVLAVYDMPKLEDPEIKVKVATVAAIYPGASAHELELEVTDPIEKSIREMGEVDIIESHSYNDLAIIEVTLKSTVPDKDVEQCWDLLRRKVGDSIPELPSGVSVSVQDDFGLVYGMMYALTGDGMDAADLSRYAEFLKREIGNVDGVARVNIYGDNKKCVNIDIHADRLATLGISPLEIINTVNGQNSTYYSGYYDNGDNRVRVSVDDKFRNAEQIGNLVIQGHENDQFRLKDIADVYESTEKPVRNSMEFNGQHSIGIAVAAASGTDIVKVGKAVEKKLDELQAGRLPAGIECHKIFFQPQQVSSALGTFTVNLIESVIIVIAILMLTMGFRSGLIIGISLVIIVIGTFIFLAPMGGTMQRVSLAAFVFAMGMLVDNAIVIVDGILVDLKSGKPRMEAMTAIGKKTSMALLGATSIAILSFFPIFLSPDSAGVYVRDLFIVLAVSLLLSWILALVHVPLMANSLLTGKKYEGSADTSEGSIYSGWIYKVLRKSLGWALRHRLTTVGITTGLVVLAFFGYGKMKQGFFPDMVYDQLYMEYKLPEGTNSTRVEKDLKEIREWLQKRPEITDVTTSIGGTPARYNLVRSIALPSLSYGELIVNFESAKALDKNIDEIQKELTSMYPDAYLKLKKYNIMYKRYPIELLFSGPDPAILKELADTAAAVMKSIPEVCLITRDWDPAVPVLDIDYDQSAARNAGISRQDISLSMLSASGGIPIGTIYNGTNKDNVYLNVTDNDGKSVADLENVPVFRTIPDLDNILTYDNLLDIKNGTVEKEDLIEDALQTVPLKQAGSGIHVRWEDPVIPRYNGQRASKIMCSPVTGVETEKARQLIEDKINLIDLPAGYTVTWEGEKSASDETMKYLFGNIPLALVMIIAILILLFGDYKKPAIILCCIPLLAVGVVGAILLSGKAFTFCAIVGAIGLVGMMMKNCIVLIDEIGDQIKSGKEPAEALISSSESRLRAVTMASMTTILGMIPLINDAMFGSMAVTIMGGLLFSTIATLFFVPLLYAVFFGIKL